MIWLEIVNQSKQLNQTFLVGNGVYPPMSLARLIPAGAFIMANRFTDSEKWKDDWFCSLNEREKLFWIFLCDNCNHAGIWKVNWHLVNFYLPNFAIDFKIEKFNDRIQVLSKNKWYLKKFVTFQQKIDSLEQLNQDNNAHLGIIKCLTSYNSMIEGLPSTSLAPNEHLARGPGKGKGKGNSKGRGVVVKEGTKEEKNENWDEA